MAYAFPVLFPDGGYLIAGKKAYSLTWGLQYVNLFMINTGFIILAGQALKVRSNEDMGLHFSVTFAYYIQLIFCQFQ